MQPSQKSDTLPERDNIDREDQIKITFYTDPLCCWSWAFEKHWRQLVTRYSAQISYRIVLGGMIPSWPKYNDPLNSISVPAQMGPLWMYAGELTQSKMCHSIWVEDPPHSSFPPSIAVKTAGLQSAKAAERYLLDMRVAMMEEGLNISKDDVLLAIARHIQIEEFDFDRFVQDWRAGNGRQPFREDLCETRFHGIGRFPTLTFQSRRGPGIILVGYRPYEVLVEAFDCALNAGKTGGTN